MNKHFEIKVFPKIEDVYHAAADIFVELLNTKGKNTFIVPGGKTPCMFYCCLANQVRNWINTTLVLSDERLVPENVLESNYCMIKTNLLDHIQREKPPKLIPIVNGFSQEQSNQILESLNSSTYLLLPPKAAFLGIGTDGHTASLFPGDEEKFYNNDPFYILNRSDEPFQRISVSLKILSETPLLMFLVVGKEKKTVLRQIVNKYKDGGQLPVQSVIKSAQGRVQILCDQSAAPY